MVAKATASRPEAAPPNQVLTTMAAKNNGVGKTEFSAWVTRSAAATQTKASPMAERVDFNEHIIPPARNRGDIVLRCGARTRACRVGTRADACSGRCSTRVILQASYPRA